MKRINAKNIMEKGGLMIEALAMLGLIAVVTPTMYKKSAERTMEIEDINTATTIRTISNAADSYISANYSTILADMTSSTDPQAQLMRNINIEDIMPYLPYGFDVEKSLVNYSTPKIGVQRPDTTSNSLTTFVLFPAKADEEEGIGQERTSRIASLIGANGGYTREIESPSTPSTTETIAKGIGGIWALNKDNLNSLFGEDDGSGNKTYSGNINSIVTASSETIDISAAAAANNDKYLQRGLSNGEKEEKWRTAMSSDLYMGGIREDPIYEDTEKMHSIRFIKNLVVGQETGFEEDKEYGLYIAAGEGVSSAAYIGGALKALGGEFQVTGDDGSKLLRFISQGEESDKFHFEVGVDSLRYGYNGSPTYNFEVTSGGDITNYGNIALAQGGGNSISIGSITGGGNLISGDASGKIVKILMNDSAPVSPEAGISAPTYTTSPTFNVEVGSNMKVHGILAAGQLDTNKIRASTLSVGSENVDDANKWMTVDKDGVRITDPDWGEAGSSRLIFRKPTNGTYNQPGEPSVMMEAYIGGDLNKVSGLRLNQDGTTAIYNGNFGQQGIVKGRKIVLDSKAINLEANAAKLSVSDEGNVNIIGQSFAVGDDVQDLFVVDVQSKTLAVRDDGQDLFVVDVKNQGVVFNNTESELTISGADLLTDDGLIIGNPDPNSPYRNIMTIDTTTNGTAPKGESVYIRKGMIEITSSDHLEDRPLSANEGTGIIKASRFVANQGFSHPIRDKGLPYVYKEENKKMVRKVDYDNPYNINETYEYDKVKRYDTYMVNPAYTSVMHDIKLTTRAGARLSDILPDFINKGIYVVRNSYRDISNDFVDNSIEFLPTSGAGIDLTKYETAGTWASPYVGEIPAPQCPPGYGRVVTLAPISFEVAQSGNIGIHGERRFVKRTSPIATDESSGKKVLEPYEFVKGTVSPTGSTETLNVAFKTEGEEKVVNYVIGTNSPNVKPFSVQQSNWLKTHVRPRTNSEGFTTSWDAFMGFIYMEKEYGDLIEYLTIENKNPRFVYKADGEEDEDEIPDIFWNIFPVRRNSLDAYATVYCYFDRSNGMAVEINSNGLVDQYSPNQGYTSYQKKSSDGYIERLNDPTLKYDETW